MPLSRAMAAALVALAIGAIASACSSPPDSSAHSTVAAPPPPQPSSFLVARDLPPVPGNVAQGAGHPEAIRTAYEFAARKPEVLRYIPCFCGCERMGHQGNDDCFVSQRDAKGAVRAWETHGIVCEICIIVANDAMRMHNAGASVQAIRAEVVRRYGAGRPQTPTPMPHGRGNSHAP